MKRNNDTVFLCSFPNNRLHRVFCSFSVTTHVMDQTKKLRSLVEEEERKLLEHGGRRYSMGVGRSTLQSHGKWLCKVFNLLVVLM